MDRHIGSAVDAFRSAGLEDLARRLEVWDRHADQESTEATLFHSWWGSLRRSFMYEYYDGEEGYFPDRVLEDALAGDLELPAGLAEDAAKEVSSLADLPWGEAHQLVLDHPLASIPLVGALFRFGRSGIPREGGPYSVNVASFVGSSPPYRVVWGPSERHVVDMADPDGSGGFILPGGESGYPDNPHSFDQLELWREGRLWLLPVNPRGKGSLANLQARALATVRLEPAGG